MNSPIERTYQAFTAGDGFDYECEPLDCMVWRCGKCRRGIIMSKDRKCRVCKRDIIIKSSVNRLSKRTA